MGSAGGMVARQEGAKGVVTMGRWDEVEEKEIPTGGFRTAPRGRYPLRVIAAEAGTTSKKQLSQVALRLTIEGHSEECDGVSVFENLITEGKAAPYTKTKLRQLGIDLDANPNITDEEIADELVGKLVFGDLSLEVAKKTDEVTNKIVTKFVLDEDGNEVPAKQNRVIAFYAIDTGGATQSIAEEDGDGAEEEAPPAKPAKTSKPAKSATPPKGGQQQFASFPPGGAPPPWAGKGAKTAQAKR